jgi:hypothetical protein
MKANGCATFGDVCPASVNITSVNYGDDFSWTLTDDDSGTVLVSGGFNSPSGSGVVAGSFSALLTGNATFHLWQHGYFGDNGVALNIVVHGEVVYTLTMPTISIGFSVTESIECEALKTYIVRRDGDETILYQGTGKTWTDTAVPEYYDHTWCVTTLCMDGSESVPACVTLPGCMGYCAPAENLTVIYPDIECEALLTWEPPLYKKSVIEALNKMFEQRVANMGPKAPKAMNDHRNTANPNPRPASSGKGMQTITIPGRGEMAYVIDCYPGNNEPATMSLDNPGTLNYLGGSNDGILPGGGDWIDEEWWTFDCNYSYGIYKINTVNGTYEYVTDHNIPDYILGLAHYDATGTTYVNVNNIFQGDFYTIDLNTGNGQYAFTSQYPLLTFTITNDGRFIGLNKNGPTIVEVDPATGACTTLINLSFSPEYIQDMTLDRATNTVYWASYSSGGSSVLYEVDLNNNTLINLGAIYNDAEIVGFAIPATANQDIAAKPNPFTATAAGTTLYCNLSWKNPTTTVGGDPLTGIDEIILKRGATEIGHWYSVTPGQNMSFTDELPAAGNYCYSVYAVTSEGDGAKATDCAVVGDVCEITVVMHDSWGDGWNGGQLIVAIDGALAGIVTLASGSSGTQSVLVSPGELELLWYPGTYDYEISFEVLDNVGEMICQMSSMEGVAGLFFTTDYECASDGTRYYRVYRDDEIIADYLTDTSYIDNTFNVFFAFIFVVLEFYYNLLLVSVF